MKEVLALREEGDEREAQVQISHTTKMLEF